MFSGLFLAILNLFRAVSFLMLQFHVSPLKVHLHFQESQAISGISSLKLFLDFLSLHTFVVIFFGTMGCMLFSYFSIIFLMSRRTSIRKAVWLLFSLAFCWDKLSELFLVFNKIDVKFPDRKDVLFVFWLVSVYKSVMCIYAWLTQST